MAKSDYEISHVIFIAKVIYLGKDVDPEAPKG